MAIIIFIESTSAVLMVRERSALSLFSMANIQKI